MDDCPHAWQGIGLVAAMDFVASHDRTSADHQAHFDDATEAARSRGTGLPSDEAIALIKPVLASQPAPTGAAV